MIVRLDQMAKRVIPDLTAAADIELQRADHALKVPLAALHWDKKQAFVYLRDGKRKDITLGFKTNVEAQVLDGLHDGDEVRLN